MSDPLDQIKKLYYAASKATIVRDFDAAIDLLKSLGGEDERERATVYMQGLAEMKAQWASPSPASGAPRSATAPRRSGRSTRGGRRPR